MKTEKDIEELAATIKRVTTEGRRDEAQQMMRGLNPAELMMLKTKLGEVYDIKPEDLLLYEKLKFGMESITGEPAQYLGLSDESLRLFGAYLQSDLVREAVLDDTNMTPQDFLFGILVGMAIQKGLNEHSDR